MNGHEINGFILQPGAGKQLVLKGGPLVIKADGDDTADAVGVWEDTVPPNEGPPLHIHHKSHELFYVLAGKFKFRVGHKTEEVGDGGFVFIPKGLVHTYKNVGQSGGRLFGFVVPSGLERFYQAQARLGPGQMTPEKYRELGRAYDMDVIGDPLCSTFKL